MFFADVIERLLHLTGLKGLQLRFTRDFNRLAALTALESLSLDIPEHAKIRVDDFTQLLTLPNLASLQISSPLPTQELQAVFRDRSRLTARVLEKNTKSDYLLFEDN